MFENQGREWTQRFGVALVAAAVFGWIAPAIAAAAATPSGPIVFGGDRGYPPFEWRSPAGPEGFNVELARSLADVSAVDVRVRLGRWDTMVEALRTGRVDVLPMFRTHAREREFLFTDPFLYVELAGYGRPALPAVRNVSGLSGRSVAVIEDSYSSDRLAAAEVAVAVELVEDTRAALRLARRGVVDYAIVARPVAHRLVRGDILEQRGQALWSAPYAFAVRKGDTQLLAWLEESLARSVGNGRYAEIYTRWRDDLEPNPLTLVEALRMSALVLAPVTLLALVGISWSWTLRRTVRARTRELRGELERRRSAEEEMRRLATHEPETGLARRPHLRGLLEERIAQSDSPFELAVLHLGGLGPTTRTFGHETGAKAICAFARRIEALEPGMSGYFGGQTFCVTLSPDTGRAVCAALGEPITLDAIEVDPDLRIGVARYPVDSDRPDELLRMAETALSAVNAARERLRFYEAGMEPDPEDLALVCDFRRDGGAATTVALQPQVELASGRVCGAEALVRWEHPVFGLIAPGRFVPLLEQAGLIGRLTERMVERAAEVAADLRARGMPCTVSVNLSVQDLLEVAFVDSLFATLEREGARPRDLKVELTETSFDADVSRIADRLARLRERGIRVSIDDFGTGYASLSYLTEFPVDEVKIDRLFISDMESNQRHRSVVESTLLMAKGMQLGVVAEGIEDAATVRTLLEIGCEAGQGYHLGRPMAWSAFREWYTRRGG